MFPQSDQGEPERWSDAPEDTYTESCYDEHGAVLPVNLVCSCNHIHSLDRKKVVTLECRRQL